MCKVFTSRRWQVRRVVVVAAAADAAAAARLRIVIRAAGDKIVMSASECVCVCVCVSACLSACPRAFPNHTRDLYQFLCMLPIAVARSSCDGVTKSQGKGQFWGVFCPFKSIDNLRCIVAVAFAAKEIIQLPIMSCSRGIMWYATQTQIVFWKFSGAGDAAYRPRRRWWNCTVRAKSDIYDCLV